MISRILLVTSLAATVLASTLPLLESRQQKAQVVTKCTQPNTVALTFVCNMFHPLTRMSNFPPGRWPLQLHVGIDTVFHIVDVVKPLYVSARISARLSKTQGEKEHSSSVSEHAAV
jgi:hypothetical protein